MACDDQYEPGISKYHNNIYKVVSTGVLSNKNSPIALLWIGHWGLIQPYGTPSGNVVMEIVYTVYLKKYAHGFVVLCFVVVLSIFIRVALLALGQSLDCHSASEVSLMDMGKSVNV